MADECVSRILCAATPASRFASGRERRGAAIIPLGAESLRRSSSLPEGRNGALLRARRIRAGPALPSYLALLHAGFSVPRMSPSERWALTPPFHPCQMRSTERGEPQVLPGACRRGANDTGGLSFCGTFRSRVPSVTLARDARTSPLALPGALPCRGRLLRVHHGWSPDFPPVDPACAGQTGDHPTHPPFQLYLIFSSLRRGHDRAITGSSRECKSPSQRGLQGRVPLDL
jgi:hypothetical protein